MLGVAVLQGCASYVDKPLPETARLSPTPNGQRSSLSIGSVGQVAATYNPALISARTRLPEEEARAFAAGLLPDPQLSATFDNPLSSAAGLVNGYAYGLGYDLRPLILRGETLRAAEMTKLQVALDVEWQTWQTMQKARDLYIQLTFLERKSAILEREISVFQQDIDRLNVTLESGDTTIDNVAISLVVLSDAENQLQIVRSQRVSVHDQLAALIGLRPEANFRTRGVPVIGVPSSKRIESLLKTLPQRRPDLLALRAGYQSQNARVRGSILGQFPSLTVGITRAKDTAGLKTNGFGITLNLPIFDGNRGNIAVENATRDRLYAEYQERLDTSASEILALKRSITVLKTEMDGSRSTLAEIDRIIAKGADAYLAGDFPAQAYSSLLVARYSRQLAIAELEQQMWQATNALVSVLGGVTAPVLNAPSQSVIDLPPPAKS